MEQDSEQKPGTGPHTSKASYFSEFTGALKSLSKGLGLTQRHFGQRSQRRAPMHISHPDYFQQADGPVTVQYPAEQVPVPDNGRYRLYLETPDCIGCDQCARICPVDCITIEKIRATEELPKTSDGTKVMFYLPTFDIDMAKCCYCGLCTVVCPTECIIMTKSYDYSEYDRDNLVLHFGNLSPDEAAVKQKLWEEAEKKKKAAKAAALAKAKKEKAAKAKGAQQGSEKNTPEKPAKPGKTSSDAPKEQDTSEDNSTTEQ